VTVTGLATPSIDARVANRLGLPRHVKRLPVFGLGCVAGASGLARCADLMAAHPGGIAVLMSVELCSLTFQPGDRSMANIVATGLFGDGACAVVLAGRDHPGRGPAIVASRSVFYPGTQDVMGWEVSEKGFKLVLSPGIAGLIREHLRPDVDGFLAEHGLRRSDVRDWMVHTGGPKVFTAIEQALELSAEALESTRSVLRSRGNLSSASVLVVMNDVLKRRKPPEGTWGLMLAVGPGFCSEMVLVRW
jgi:alkylresorcinol/alkylpyrone synthase